MTANIVNVIQTFIDYPHPTEHSITVFMSGCGHNCKNCQNKSLQDFSMGTPYTPEEFLDHLTKLAFKYKTNNVVLQGGDPLYGKNIKFTQKLLALNSIDNRGFNFCVYTGFDIKYVKKYFNKGNSVFWKCGLYDENKKMISSKTDAKFILASYNQEFYNTKFKRISKKGILKF